MKAGKAGLAMFLVVSGCHSDQTSDPATSSLSLSIDQPVVEAGRRRELLRQAITPAQQRPMITNGCPAPDFTVQIFRDHPLSTESFRDSTDLRDLLCDPSIANAVKYIVSCALEKDQVVTYQLADGMPVELHGLMGIAQRWHDQPCDVECQEFVTSCLFSRTNFYGVTVNIGMGAYDLPGGDPIYVFPPVQEGAFYGNIFADDPVGYSCRGRDYDPYYFVVRRCAQPDGGCFFDDVGPCGPVDGLTGETVDRWACETMSPEGVYKDCHTRRRGLDGRFLGTKYTHPMTVFVPRAQFIPPPACR